MRRLISTVASAICLRNGVPLSWTILNGDEVQLDRSGLSIHLNRAFGLSVLGMSNGTTGASVIEAKIATPEIPR